MPFESLKNSQNEYLVKDYAFSYTYSAQYLLKTKKNKTNFLFNRFIGFAPVQYDTSLHVNNLEGADAAMSRISKHYYFSKKYIRSAATRSGFLKHAAKYSIIQLLTHADADTKNKEPVIYFADSILTTSELQGFNHSNTNLLVLSACNTGVGKVIKGEGTLSFGRAFATLGIPSVITTLWSVENQATYNLTESFYKYLSQGSPKDVALQKAKLEYSGTHSREKQDPIYWAGLILIGDASSLASPGATYIIWTITIAFFLIVIGYKLINGNHSR